MSSPSPASTRRGFDPLEILVEASDIAAGRTLNLDELLQALADLIRKVIDYQLFAVHEGASSGVRLVLPRPPPLPCREAVAFRRVEV